MVENRLNKQVVESHFFPQPTRDINHQIIPAGDKVLAFRDFAREVWFYQDDPLKTERGMVSIGLVEEENRCGYEVRLEVFTKISPL